eukprot:jgi/Hompol1/3480/HPOL_003262-RA
MEAEAARPQQQQQQQLPPITGSASLVSSNDVATNNSQDAPISAVPAAPAQTHIKRGTLSPARVGSAKAQASRQTSKPSSANRADPTEALGSEIQSRLMTVADFKAGPHFELGIKRKLVSTVTSSGNSLGDSYYPSSHSKPHQAAHVGQRLAPLDHTVPMVPQKKDKPDARPVLLKARRPVVNPARPKSPVRGSNVAHSAIPTDELLMDAELSEQADILVGFVPSVIPPIGSQTKPSDSQKRIRVAGTEDSSDEEDRDAAVESMGANQDAFHLGGALIDSTDDQQMPDIHDQPNDMQTDRDAPQHLSEDDPKSPFSFFKFVEEHPTTKEFVYMIPIKTSVKRGHPSFNPYNLHIVEFSEINTKSVEGFYTASSEGITHFNNLGHGEFTPLKQWIREHKLFHSLLRIAFFSRYRLWKCFTLWKRTVLHTKIQHAKKLLSKNLFLMHPVLRTALLKIQALNADIVLNKRLVSVDDQENLELSEFVRKQKLWVDEISVVVLRSWGDQIRSIVEHASLTCLKEKGFDVQSSLITSMMAGQLGEALQKAAMESSSDPAGTRKSLESLAGGTKKLTFTEQAARRTECRRLQRFVKLVDYGIISTLQLLAIQSVQDLLKYAFRGCSDSDVVIDSTGTGTVIVGENGYIQNADPNIVMNEKFGGEQEGMQNPTGAGAISGVQVGGIVVGNEVATSQLCECGFDGFSDILSRIIMSSVPQIQLVDIVEEEGPQIDADAMDLDTAESSRPEAAKPATKIDDKWRGAADRERARQFTALFRTELLVHQFDQSRKFYFSPSLQDYLTAIDTILKIYMATVERFPPLTNSIPFLDPANLAGGAYSAVRGLEDSEFGEGPQIGSIIMDGGYFRELCGRIRGVLVGMFSNASHWVSTLESVRSMWIANEQFHGLEDLRKSAGEIAYLLATSSASEIEGGVAGILLKHKTEQDRLEAERIQQSDDQQLIEQWRIDSQKPINILELGSQVSFKPDGTKFSPLVEFFDTALTKFLYQKQTMTSIPVRSTINNLLIDTNKLKSVLVPSPERCFNEVARILPGLARDKNELLLTEVQTWVRVLNTQPSNVEGFVEYLSWLEKVRESMPIVDQLEEEVTKMYALLDQYKIQIQPTDLAMFQTLNPTLRSLKDSVDVAMDTKEESITRFTIDLEKSMSELMTEVLDIRNRAQDPMVLNSSSKSDTVVKFLEELRSQLEKVEILKKRYEQWGELFKRGGNAAPAGGEQAAGDSKASAPAAPAGGDPNKGSELEETKVEIEMKMTLWTSLKEWETLTDTWKAQPFDSLVTDDINTKITTFLKIVYNLDKGLPPNEVVPRLKNVIDEYRTMYPTILDLRNPSLKQRHWEKIQDAIGKTLVKDETFTLSRLMDLRVFDFKEEIGGISSQAGSEAALEEMLSRVVKNWSEAEFIVTPYRDNKDVFILGTVEDIQTLLEDSQVTIATIKGSRFIGPIKTEVDRWDKQLTLFSETLDAWLNCQRNWLYLESIFSAPDIQRQLPDEARMFSQVDRSWKDVMRKVSRNPNAMKSGTLPGLLETMQQNNVLLDQIQKCLEDYLESKRLLFPRFYFLSNDELLEILSQTKNPQAVQPHLSKCFDGIKSLEFSSNDPKSIDI